MKVNKRTALKASSQKVGRRIIKAEDEIMEEDIDMEEAPAAEVTVDPEATELVFEAEDVAELVAEVTGEEVAVTVDTDSIVFTVGDEEFTIEPDGDEEILETSRKVLRGKKSVKASRNMSRRRASRPVKRY